MTPERAQTLTVPTTATREEITAKAAIITDGLESPAFVGLGNGLNQRIRERAHWFKGDEYAEATPTLRREKSQQILGDLRSFQRMIPEGGLNAYTTILKAGEFLADQFARPG